MSLEKGISRTGTVLGVVLGVFFAIITIFLCLDCGTLSHFSNKYKKEYSKPLSIVEREKEYPLPEGFSYIEDENDSKERVYEEKRPSEVFYVYLPTFGVGVLAVFAPFLIGFYGVRGMFGTINWIIKGFRE